MASLFIQSDDSDNMELIAKLAEKLGIHVNSITEEQSEDFAIGTLMSNAKTGKSVSRDAIMKKLRK